MVWLSVWNYLADILYPQCWIRKCSASKKENSNTSLHSLIMCTLQSGSFYRKVEWSSLASNSLHVLVNIPTAMTPMDCCQQCYIGICISRWNNSPLFRFPFLYNCPKVNKWHIIPYQILITINFHLVFHSTSKEPRQALPPLWQCSGYPPQTITPWWTEYFKLREFKKWHEQKRFSDLPLNQDTKPSCKKCPSYSRRKGTSLSLRHQEESKPTGLAGSPCSPHSAHTP